MSLTNERITASLAVCQAQKETGAGRGEGLLFLFRSAAFAISSHGSNLAEVIGATFGGLFAADMPRIGCNYGVLYRSFTVWAGEHFGTIKQALLFVKRVVRELTG